jgi:hypothetical protein
MRRSSIRLLVPAAIGAAILLACSDSSPTDPSVNADNFANASNGNGPTTVGGNPSPAGRVSCVRALGYYKNHLPLVQEILSRTTAITSAGVITTGGVSYTAQNLVDALSAPPTGDIKLLLLHQYLTAQLNWLNMPAGTTLPAEVAIAIGNSNQYLLGNLTLTRDQVLQLMNTLARFNGGGFGTFKNCGDG